MRTLTCPEPEGALFSACFCVSFSLVSSLDLPLRVDGQCVCPLRSLPPAVPALLGVLRAQCPPVPTTRHAQEKPLRSSGKKG